MTWKIQNKTKQNKTKANKQNRNQRQKKNTLVETGQNKPTEKKRERERDPKRRNKQTNKQKQQLKLSLTDKEHNQRQRNPVKTGNLQPDYKNKGTVI